MLRITFPKVQIPTNDLIICMSGEEGCSNNFLKFYEDGVSSIDFRSTILKLKGYITLCIFVDFFKNSKLFINLPVDE